VEICTNTVFMPFVVLENGVLNQSSLTARERDVLHLWAKGFERKKIAEQLHLSPETVKKHLRNIYLKLDAHNKVQALTKAGYL
jgi:DNA-binding CsgD family transcriptional regulator